MNIKKILNEITNDIKEIDYSDEATIYRLKSKSNLVVMWSNDSSFIIDRDLFFYLDNQKIDYNFLLVNKSNNNMFYLTYFKFANWIKSSFDSCDKDDLYFGKVVLQNKIDETKLRSNIEKL